MVSNNCANFELNYAAIFKFCHASLPEISAKDFLRDSPNANFRSEMVSNNCTNIALICATIFKFCAAQFFDSISD